MTEPSGIACMSVLGRWSHRRTGCVAPAAPWRRAVAESRPNGNGSLASNLVSIVAITRGLAIAPGILVMGTSFTRLVVVLSMLRTALGLQQTPPKSVIIGWRCS